MVFSFLVFFGVFEHLLDVNQEIINKEVNKTSAESFQISPKSPKAHWEKLHGFLFFFSLRLSHRKQINIL